MTEMTTVVYDERFSDLDSSVVDVAWYDREAKTIYVELNSGSIYAYFNRTQVQWDAFKNASSKGGHYNASLRGTGGLYVPNTNVSFVARPEAGKRKYTVSATIAIEADVWATNDVEAETLAANVFKTKFDTVNATITAVNRTVG